MPRLQPAWWEVKMSEWFVAKSKPRKENLLIGNLAKWGVETFYPYIRERGLSSGRLEPLFPSYVFCLVDTSSPKWQAVRWAPGLSYFLQSGDDVSPVPDVVIGYLRERIQTWNSAEIRQEFHKGDSVSIVSGPFAGFEAIFSEYLSSRDRCRILMKSIQGISSVEVPKESLELSTQPWRTRFGHELG
jgi:transcription elongation factor/antiterminator RfaH